jgi:hypothetical protein
MKKAILFFAAVVILASCKKDEEDTTRPVIGSVKVNGAVADEHDVEAGTTISIEVAMTDNKELNQLKVDIHSADDGHTHGDDGGGEEVEEENIGVWSDTRIISVSGESDTETLSFTIPNTIKGHWHIEVSLIDKDGNEAVEYVTTLHVENANLPVFEITTNPAIVNGEIELEIGGTFLLSGTITDPDGFEHIHIEVEDEATGTVIWEQEVTVVAGNTITLTDILVGPFAAAGDYHIHIHAEDTAGFEGEWGTHVHVH